MTGLKPSLPSDAYATSPASAYFYYLTATRHPERYVDTFGIGPPLAGLPVYAILDLFVDLERDRFWWWHGAALTASLLTALAALFVFLTARRLVQPLPAFLAALAFGLGSCAWPVTSQALWQHPASTFCLSLGAWFLLRSPDRPRAAAWCGAAFGMAVLCRPTTAVVVLCTGAYLLWVDRRRCAAFVLGGLPLALILAAYNHYYFGNPLVFGQSVVAKSIALSKTGAADLWQSSWWESLPGLFVSPARGLLWFSPVLVLGLVGVVAVWKQPRFHPLIPLQAGAVLMISSGWSTKSPARAIAARAAKASASSGAKHFHGGSAGARACSTASIRVASRPGPLSLGTWTGAGMGPWLRLFIPASIMATMPSREPPSLAKESFVIFGSIYLFLSLINLRVKLFLTPAWHDGTLEHNHHLLLSFSYTNNEQSRLFQFYVPEVLQRVLQSSVTDAYLLQRWGFTFATFCCFHFYLRKWFGSELAFAGVLVLGCLMPLTYFNHLQESAPLLALTFLLALWAIRERRTLAYSCVLSLGAINNETMLFLPAVYFFFNFASWRMTPLLRLTLSTLASAAPAVLAVGIIRYVNRDRPHLGGAWHLPDNLQGILWGLGAAPLDYWETHYLYILFIFGVLWIFAYRKLKEKPKFLRRSLLTVPLFVVPHLVTGIISEVRQMLPLSFIIIPAALYFLFKPQPNSTPDDLAVAANRPGAYGSWGSCSSRSDLGAGARVSPRGPRAPQGVAVMSASGGTEDSLSDESCGGSTAGARVCFVIPTYDEADNITLLLQRLSELYRDPNVTFLVVDDESPDGTGRLVRKFAASDARVHLLEGKKRGLGAAYVRGITHAMDRLDAEVVIQMDADFSHDPADAGRLVARVAADADVAIGSRYVPGGSVDESWGFRRRQLSLWGNRLARWIAGLKGVRDCTADFKAIRTAALRAAKVEEITVLGYAFQVALLHRLLHAGARVVEEPIYFRDRERGVTKLGMDSMLEFFSHIWWLRLTSHRTFIKFSLTGLSGVFVNLGSFQLLTALGAHRYLASPIAIKLSIISNFLINNYWTFADREMVGAKRIRGLKFNVVSLLSLAVSYGTFVLLSLLLPGVAPVWLQGLAIVPAVLVNYFLNSYWTFREPDRK